jgi:hypothetical protein
MGNFPYVGVVVAVGPDVVATFGRRQLGIRRWPPYF